MSEHHFKDPAERIHIPESWIGKMIEVAYALPMGQGNAAGGVSVAYPGQNGVLVENHDTSIVIRYEKLMKGEKQKRLMCIPKCRIWVIDRADGDEVTTEEKKSKIIV